MHDKSINALYFMMGGGEGWEREEEEEVRIKVMRTRVYLKAAAEDKIEYVSLENFRVKYFHPPNRQPATVSEKDF